MKTKIVSAALEFSGAAKISFRVRLALAGILTALLTALPSFAAVGLIAGNKGAGSTAASSTIYGNYSDGLIQVTNAPTAETSAQTLFRTAGTLSNLTAFFQAYDRGSGTVQSRTAASCPGTPANGNMSMSITGSGSIADSTHNDAVSSGNCMDWVLTTGSGGTTSIITHVEALFAPSSGSITLSKWGGYGSATAVGFQATAFEPITGNFQGSSSPAEAQYQWESNSAGTWRNLWIYLSANTYSGGSTGTFKSRVNTANGNQAVSVTNGATGLYEDNTHTDTIALNDKLDTELIAGGTSGSGTVDNFGSEFASTNGTQQLLLSTSANNGLFTNGSSTTYAGFGANTGATEANFHVIMAQATTTSLFQVQVVANSLNSGQATTFKLFKNGVAGNEAVSNTATATGYLQDATHTDSFTASDTSSFQVVAGTGTAINYNGIGVLSQVGSATTSPNMPPVIF